MAKLVILNQNMAGRTHELNVDRTTIGRVEDNTFQIADQSVSSHHCEVLLQGTDVLIRDLNSTNGSFINGEKISENVLKPGQTLRLGQVELKLEAEGVSTTGASPAPSTPPSAPAKKATQGTTSMPRGVSLSDLESGGQPLATNTAFSKKRNKIGIYFWIGAAVVGVIIIILLLMALSQASSHK
jgi:pSer/pThr/pTyr-binding forkhead associated (FHA) protein